MPGLSLLCRRLRRTPIHRLVTSWLTITVVTVVIMTSLLHLHTLQRKRSLVNFGSIGGGHRSRSWESKGSQQPPLVREEEKYDKWIVVTSVAPPTRDVFYLSQLRGWRMVMVGDVHTPANWSVPGVVYLNLHSQHNLGFTTTTRLPLRSYSRKNIGYLYAISRGAKVIYETDDDNRPLDSLRSFRLDQTSPGLMYAGKDLFNPCTHFGQPTLWPRGYPLRAVGGDQVTSYRLSKQWKTPIIQQGLVNGDPDLDAIFRLTRKKTSKTFHVTFDSTAPPVYLPAGVFSPFNSQNTLFHYASFWALYMPITTTSRICDIWRGYWAQRLLWEIDGHLGFFPPNADQVRNVHSYMKDASEEKDMYYATDRLLVFLKEWTCPASLTFFGCVRQLSKDMSVEGFWGRYDAVTVSVWLEDLRDLGYTEPQRVDISSLQEELSLEKRKDVQRTLETGASFGDQVPSLSLLWLLTVSKGSFINYIPVPQTPPSVTPEPKVGAFSNFLSQVVDLCSQITALNITRQLVESNNHHLFSDILLIIVFNNVEWMPESVKFLELMHRYFFPNIVYCGGECDQECFNNIRNKTGLDFSFIDARLERGVRGYQCLTRAVEMSYNVSGYFVIADDTLLKTWNIKHLNRDKIWLSQFESFNCSAKDEYEADWEWWRKKYRPRAMSALHRLKRQELVNKDYVIKEFFRRLKSNLKSTDLCIHAPTDSYFIPSRFAIKVSDMLENFARYDVFMELAIPTSIYGLVDRSEVVRYTGIDLWGDDRYELWPIYDKNLTCHYIHPLKYSKGELSQQFSGLNRFCGKHLANLLANA